MRVIVTGGAGFIGSAVCRHFIQDLGHDVVVIDKLTYAGNLQSLTPVAVDARYAFEKHDICDVDAVNAIFAKHRPDAVIHLAAESHVDRSMSGSDIFVRTNVLGTFTLLEAARKYMASSRRGSDDFRFLHVSTDEVYGSLATMASLPRPHPTIQARPIRRPKQPPTISLKRGTGLSGCRSWSRTAPTIMDPITFPKSLFR